MNYYNPYFVPYTNAALNTATNTGLFSKLFGNKLTLSSILSGTGKVVNFANQTIPLIKQMGPLVNNAKTMFRVMNEFKKIESPTISDNKIIKNEKKEEVITSDTSNNEGPTFFL